MKKGVSLIELIIYMAVVAIVLLVVIDLVTNLVYSQAKNSHSSEVTQNLEFALQKIGRSVEGASAVNGTYPSDSLNLTVAGQTEIYAIQGGVLTYKKGESAAVAVTSSKVKMSGYPDGSSAFVKIINGTSTTVKINLTAKVANDANINQSMVSTFLMRGK